MVRPLVKWEDDVKADSKDNYGWIGGKTRSRCGGSARGKA